MTESLEKKSAMICHAIGNKLVVQFKYDRRTRIVEPFIYGRDSAGKFVLRGFQIRGSDKTKPHCWRLYSVDEISDLRVTLHEFSGQRDEYGKGDPKIIEIECNLAVSSGKK